MRTKGQINVYDFDGTLYRGDSSIDFFIFALKYNKKNILILPKIILYFILYLIRIVSKEKFKSAFFSFLKNCINHEKMLKEFWNKHEQNINFELRSIIERDNQAIIVTASPEFLIKPIATKLGVKTIIASKVDISNGKWLDNNCYGENKIRYLKQIYKNIEINNSYSDSYSDRFIANESNNAYMIYNNKISKYDADRLFLKKIGRIAVLLSVIFFCIYFLLGMLINYNYNLSNNFNLLFQSDTRRVYDDFVKMAFSHNRIGVHPLILFVQPFVLLLKGFTQNEFIAIVVFEAIVGALSVKYIYKTLFILSKNGKISLLLSLIYGFSFSSVIFSTTIEIYSLSALSLIVLWYYIINNFKLNFKFNYYKYVIIGICTTGVLLTNYCVFVVGVLLLLLSKKIGIKKFILINLFTILGIIMLSFIQENLWVSAPSIYKTFTTSVEKETDNYASFDLNLEKLENVVDDIYMNGIVAKDVYVKQISNVKKFDNEHTVITFKDGYNYKDAFIIVFYVILLFIIVYNFKYNKILNMGLLLSLGGMTLLHLFYGNEDTFLYSQNFIYLIILLFGVNYNKKHKFINIWLSLLLIFEILKNLIVFRHVVKIIARYVTANKILAMMGIYKEILIFSALILFVLALLFIVFLLIKKYMIDYDKKRLIYILCLVLVIPCLFIKLDTLINCDINSGICNSITSVKLSIDKYNDSFKKRYSEEVGKYEKYVNQYKDFVSSRGVTITNNFNNTKFYLFGIGNREKYIYRNGILRHINSEKIYRRFDVEQELIIPNLFTVLIKTKQGKFYKIVEDNESVHIEGENEYFNLPNTVNYIKLANLDKYKYSEILKVLYQEILFNIKDGIIYPNIFVYDEVWYRDAAYGAMVLKITNNINLISKWILSIDDYYDRANGNEENDNLGEVLYLLSLVTDKNNDTVKKIVSKANNIKIEDKNGFYVSGKTDGSIRPSYQTEWLKFGLKKLGIENDYEYNLSDNYSNFLWFCNYDTKKITINNYSSNYPYLGYAQRHLVGDKTNIYISNQLYPLSWENKAKQADYSKMTFLGDYFIKNKIAPTHVWSAAELFLLLKNY